MESLPIALDAMGGDRMPEAAVVGAAAAARRGTPVVLVGDEARLRGEMERRGLDLPLEHAADVIGMDDSASDVRRRRTSSVMVAMRLVREGRASACVSMGHSGATMAAALLSLGRLGGVERPAILANMPLEDGFTALLDAGANADCRPLHLQQFAVMGSIFVREVWGRPEPSVGLMSIGEEPGKGNELTRAAHELLAATPGIRFHGNVEGRDLFAGVTDVVVTDGFTGNVVLKLAEGEAQALFGWIRGALGGSLRSRLGAWLVRPALRGVRDRLDPGTYGAQPLLGVDGYAFIGHGSSDGRAVDNALRTAELALEADLLGRLRSGMERLEASARASAASGGAD